jgi:hypothetical protein
MEFVFLLLVLTVSLTEITLLRTFAMYRFLEAHLIHAQFLAVSYTEKN